MVKQQISKHAKDATKGDTVAADRPARVDDHQTRRRRPRARSGAAEVQRGASAAAATLPEAIDDSSASSTGSDATVRAASQPRAKPRRAGAAAASVVDRPPASTKRAMLIGMLERAEGPSVTEIGQRLGWLPHTVRAALTGLRHAGREVIRSTNESGQTIYRHASVKTPDR
jgi:hypothetical protein